MSDAFPETRWSLIAQTREPQDSPARAAAVEELCRLYWMPVYLYARREGRSQEDAEDVTQAFFASFLARDSFAAAEPERGRLRSYLLAAFRKFSVSEWRHAHRVKRGGGLAPLPLADMESQHLRHAAVEEDPAATYDRAWAASLVEETEAALARDYAARGRAELFARLRPLLAWNSAPDGAANEIAAACGLSPGAVRVALKRLRDAWRAELEKNVALTVASTDEVADEVRYVLKAWAA